ncbi:MAG TPA: hypothetical protein VGX49_13605 [Jatrophihabitans sp.]|jgi:hypothetical protein|nr:hypothetical protein [Jatrophihabitans sp.]
MSCVLVLLPSPLLPAAVWRPVAQRLAGAGWPVVELADAQPPRTAADVLTGFLRAVPPDRDAILIPHSNAGLYVPCVAAERRIRGYVFVDAALPPPTGSVRMAPDRFYDFLAGLAGQDGLLPPWTQWWQDDDLDGLFPSTEVRTQVERGQQRIPLSYFAGSLPVPPGWDERPGAYLSFGQTYQAERMAATARGWPTTVLDGRHLHQLVDPERVATEIQALIQALPAQAGTAPP